MAYNQEVIGRLDPEHMKESVSQMSGGFQMPGWEPDRLDHLKELFEKYRDIDQEKLFQNLLYFLRAIGPVCKNMAFGWPFTRTIRHGLFSGCREL